MRPDYEAIRRRLAAVTPGRWNVTHEPGVGKRSGAIATVWSPDRVVCRVGPAGLPGVAEDAEFIAHAPADIAALIARCLALEVQIAILQDGRDPSAVATMARMPVINDPVISEAVRSLEEEDNR